MSEIMSLQVHVEKDILLMVAELKKQRKVRREQVIIDAIKESYDKYVVKPVKYGAKNKQ